MSFTQSPLYLIQGSNNNSNTSKTTPSPLITMDERPGTVLARDEEQRSPHQSPVDYHNNNFVETNTSKVPPAPSQWWKWSYWWWLWLTWEWITPLILRGRRRPLQPSDLYQLHERDSASWLNCEFQRQYQVEGRRSILGALNRLFGLRFWIVGGLLRLLSDVCLLASPWVLMEILRHIQLVERWRRGHQVTMRPMIETLALVGLLFLLQLLRSVFLEHYFEQTSLVSMRAHSALAAAVYQKSLHLSSKSRQRQSPETIVSLQSVDCRKVQDSVMHFHFIWAGVLQIVCSILFLWYLLGPLALVSVGVVVCLLPLQWIVVKMFDTFRKKSLHWTQQRLELLQEILHGIRVIKYFCMEDRFVRQVDQIRHSELRSIKYSSAMRSILGSMLSIAPILMAVTTFILFAYMHGETQLSPSIIFPALVTINIIRFPLASLPLVIEFTMQSLISIKRLDTFLREEEQQQVLTAIEQRHQTMSFGDQPAIMVQQCAWEWETVPEVEKIRRRRIRGFEKLKRLRTEKKGRRRMKRMRKLEHLQQRINDEEIHNDLLVYPGDSSRLREEQWQNVNLEEDEAAAQLLEGIAVSGLQIKLEGAENQEIRSTIEHSSDVVGKLNDVSFEVQRGALACIIGNVGSGKSSLLAAMIGELRRTSGQIVINGRIAYCGQQVWLQNNNSIRENILFYKAWDEVKYRTILYACALDRDLTKLPDGDQCIIEGHGMRLSASRRTRIALARACYSDADVFLLDDPLSACGSKTGRFVFDNCINGILRGKTRLLATNSLKIPPRTDYVIVLHEGTVAQVGTFHELMRDDDNILATLMEEYAENVDGYEQENELIENPMGRAEEVHRVDVKMENANSRAQMANSAQTISVLETRLKRITVSGASLNTVLRYVTQLGGFTIFVAMLGLFILAQASIVGSDFWIALWVNGAFRTLPLWGNISLYVLLGIIALITVTLRDIIFYSRGFVAARRLHETVFKKIIHSPMSFFESRGYQLFQISRNQGQADNQLLIALSQYLIVVTQVCVVFAVISINLFWFLLAIPPLVITCMILGGLYRKTFHRLKDMDSRMHSAQVSHFAESLTGVATIRSYGMTRQFIEDNLKKIDENQRSHYLQLVTRRWVSLRLESLGALVVMVTGILVVVLFRYSAITTITAAGCGLSLTYAKRMAVHFSWLVRQHSDTEIYMHSVEQLLHFVDTQPQEPPKEQPLFPASEDWPQQGEIRFNHFSMRYEEHLPDALHDLCFTIHPGEKIGVCGKTGAGKSSIVSSLLRIPDPDQVRGAIKIDGVNIARLGIHEVRRAISVVPQDPILFSGTIRSNLDPLQQHDDHFLWECLEKAQVKEAVARLDKGLDHIVTAGDTSFGLGEKQLLVLARALAKRSKILILDEITAFADIKTEQLFQKTIKESFGHCTRLTIAHRLATIVDSDRILVLHEGRAVEFETPFNLLADKESFFSKLVQQTGPANAARIRRLVIETAHTSAWSHVPREEQIQAHLDWKEEQMRIRQSTLSPPDDILDESEESGTRAGYAASEASAEA